MCRVAGGLARGRAPRRDGRRAHGSLFDIVLRQGTAVWLSSPLEDLVVEGDRVVGARVVRDGRTVARARDPRGRPGAPAASTTTRDWRREHQGIDGSASSGAAGNLGTADRRVPSGRRSRRPHGRRVVGRLDPQPTPDGRAAFLVGERSVPYSDDRRRPRRSVRQRVRVLRRPRAPHARAREERPRPLLARHRRAARPPLPAHLRARPRVDEGDAAGRHPAPCRHPRRTWPAIGVDAGAGSTATVERFNGFARTGVDARLRPRQLGLRPLLRRPDGRTPTPTSGRSRRVRSPRSRSSPATSAPRAVSSPTSTPGCCDADGRSSTGSTLPATRPPRSWGARTRARARPSARPASSATSPPPHMATTGPARSLAAESE